MNKPLWQRPVVLLVVTALGAAIWALIFLTVSALAQPMSYRQDVRVVVQFDTPANVESLCGIVSSGRLSNVAGCANEQFIVIRNPCAYRREQYAAWLCHEIGHVNGWSAEHPGA